MKYIITESKMEQVAIKYLNKMYGDLEEYRTDERPDSLFFVKGKKVYMEHDLKNGILWVDYDTIWEDLENTFSLDYNEIQDIITKWVEDTTKLRVVSPMSAFAALAFGWKRLID
jgi:hypothetical protein